MITKRKAAHGCKVYFCDRQKWKTGGEFFLMGSILMLLLYKLSDNSAGDIENQVENEITADKNALLQEEESSTLPPELWNPRKNPEKASELYVENAESTTMPHFSENKMIDLLRPSMLVKPNISKTFNNYWHIVDDPFLQVFLYSAWYDKREGMDYEYIRVIAIRENTANNLYCILWNDDKDGVPSTVAKAEIHKIGQIYSRNYKSFDQSLVSCPLPTKKVPLNISIITETWQHPSNILPVQHPIEPEMSLAFGVCMSVSYWDIDPYRIVEWMELMKILGVQEVTMYNSSISNDSLRILQYYVQEGFLDLREMPVAMAVPGEETILLNMSPALNDCMYRNLYRYDRIVVVDLDEAIIPRNFSDLIDMYDAIQEDIELPKKMPVASLVFRNAYFFMDIGRSVDEPWFLLMQKYLRRVELSKVGYAVKSITNPAYCVGLQNHVCWISHPKAVLYTHVPVDYGVNHHYKKCHFDSYLKVEGFCKNMTANPVNDTTILKYRDEVSSTVAEILFRLDLIELFPDESGSEVIPPSAIVNNGVAMLKAEIFENQD